MKISPIVPRRNRVSTSIDTITLGGGCFWCLEAVYERVDGVTAVESGYSNGHVTKPTYEQVCNGDTGHAEVVRVSFDTGRISLREVLEIFFTIHDPTTPHFGTWSRQRHRAAWLENLCADDRFGGFFDLTPGHGLPRIRLHIRSLLN
jgi:hypothetical protein